MPLNPQCINLALHLSLSKFISLQTYKVTTLLSISIDTGVGALSIIGGGARHICRKIMYEKLTKYPHLT